MVFLVTGSCGFIGSHLIHSLYNAYDNPTVIGIDNMYDYYDVSLKEYRLNELKQYHNFKFIKGDIKEKTLVDALFKAYKPNIVIHLAAQAGVRYSVTNPDTYIESNIIGFYNVIEACRYNKVQHFIYASSSSVYGNMRNEDNSECDDVRAPLSLYAATKTSNELIAYAYSQLYGIPCTGLRFFTVYGEKGRPDMAYYKFTKKIIEGKTIQLYNNGKNYRDCTYIGDIINGIMLILKQEPKGLYRIYNIGANNPISANKMIRCIHKALVDLDMISKEYDLDEHIEEVGKQLGDSECTNANIDLIKKDYGYEVTTSFEEGIYNFIRWYKDYENNTDK